MQILMTERVLEWKQHYPWKLAQMSILDNWLDLPGIALEIRSENWWVMMREDLNTGSGIEGV